MLSAALSTYAAALIAITASLGIGAGILVACGRREWSWAGPALGLAGAIVIAWWAVRLPGEGTTALVCLGAAASAGAIAAWRRLGGLRGAAGRGAVPLLGALALASIPFAIEGHFGVLGTGFNVDMSQHLFAAAWLADPTGPAPGLYEQGYPLGPHALAVAAGELTGEPATTFSGVTIAVPAILALTALGAARRLPPWRASAVALLAAFAYLVATYLAQGSFKELFEMVFLVGLAVWLGERLGRAGSWREGLVPGVLGAGALYAYSGPGLAWLAGALVVWGAFELQRHRERAGERLRGALPAVAAGLVALVALAAPEIDRIADFGGSVGTVSERADDRAAPLLAAAGSGEGDRAGEPKFDNDLGNLFGQISPLEAFGVWPSGDFRVAPGDGAVPAVAFWLGALLGAVALVAGVGAALRRGSTALIATLLAAAAIWLAARIGSTPYTAAKALAMIAPVAMLLSARALLDPGWLTGLGGGRPIIRAGFGAAFLAGAAASSLLALGNAPVGPEEYSPGVRELSDRFAGEPTLVLAPTEVIEEQHGREWYAWEAREASPVCVRGSEDGDQLPIDLIVAAGGAAEPPFAGLELVAEADGATLWRRSEPRAPEGLRALGEGECALRAEA